MSQAEIEKNNRAFEEACARGDGAAIASLYTEDGCAFPPDGPIVRGRADIAALWGSAISEMGLKSVKLETVDLEIHGDVAHEAGKATLGLSPPGGQPATQVVKYVVVWKRTPSGWKLHRDIWNAMPAS